MRPEHRSSCVSHALLIWKCISDTGPGNAIAIEIPTRVASKALKSVFVLSPIRGCCLPSHQHFEASYRRRWPKSAVSTAPATHGHDLASPREVQRALCNHRAMLSDHLPAAPVLFKAHSVCHQHSYEALCLWEAGSTTHLASQSSSPPTNHCLASRRMD